MDTRQLASQIFNSIPISIFLQNPCLLFMSMLFLGYPHGWSHLDTLGSGTEQALPWSIPIYQHSLS